MIANPHARLHPTPRSVSARLWLLLSAFCLAAGLVPALAEESGAGSLLVAPTRLVFEGRVRSAELALVNTGTATTTYRIGMTFYAMAEDGGMREVAAPSPEDHAAHELVRYSPRQVTLEPGVSQILRVAVRKPADLPPGEYRSHLVFTPVLAPEEPSEAGGEGAGARIRLIVSVSIAVIVRQGETTATAALDPPVLRPGEAGSPPVLDMTIRRTGNQSLYGKLVATFQPAGGAPVEVGLAKGIGVYVPIPVRHFPLKLKVPPGVALQAGRLEVRFIDEDNNGRLLASAALALP